MTLTSPDAPIDGSVDETAAREQVAGLLAQANAAGGASSSSISRKEQLDHDDRRQDMGLKKAYARGLLALLWVQMLATNVVFCFYAWHGWDWMVPDGVMLGWLGATVVELIGVVAVVVRYLFPPRSA